MLVSEAFSTPIRRLPLPGFGFELVSTERPELKACEAIETSRLYADLARSGVVIYRGFADDIQDFDRFIKSHSARVTFDPARTPYSDSTAEINAGNWEMGLHRENGNLPFTPDIQWFYCQKPAERGSQTTFCDGARVLFELSGATRRQFEKRKIRYSRRIPWPNVRRFLSLELDKPVEQIDDSHLSYINDLVEGQTYQRLDDHLILSELQTSAIIVSCFSGRKAFCNSMLGPSVNYDPPMITWADGEDIDIEIWDEIKDVSHRLTYDLFWKLGDMVVVDNTRVMHGRRRLLDPSRRIFGAQSYRKEDIQ
jgi:alpha-ketoglutarate-dependent taurine dioxygenase